MKQPTRASDLVSNGVILRAVDKIVRSARSIAAQKRAGKSAKAIKLSPVRETNKTVIVEIIFNTDKITGAPEAPAYEWGSGLHDTKGSPHYIDIDAINYPYMTFMGTNGVEGLVKVPHVNHPGVKAKPFLEPAKRKHRPALKKAVAEEVGKKLRMYVRAMAVKI